MTDIAMKQMNRLHMVRGLGVFVVLGVVAFTSLGSSPAMRDAEAEVRETVELYFTGAITGEASYFEEAFDVENGHMKFVRGNDTEGYLIRTTPIRDAIAAWTRGPDPESTGRILDVKLLEDKLAHVTLEIYYKGYDYTDVLALYKVGDDWKIVNKTFISHGRRTP